MAGKELRNRTVEVRAETVENSDSETEMPLAQVQGFTEVVTTVTNPVSEHSMEVVNTVIAGESSAMQPAMEGSKNKPSENEDSLREFITNLFHKLSDKSDKIEKGNLELKRELESIKSANEKLIARFEKLNEQMTKVTDNTKELVNDLRQEVDQKLGDVTAKIITNDEKSNERFSRVEGNIKLVQSTLKDDVSKWQNETREQVSHELKQFAAYKDRLDKLDDELANMKVNNSENLTVVGNTSSMPHAGGNPDTDGSACGPAICHVNDVNHKVTCENDCFVNCMNDCIPSNNQAHRGEQCDAHSIAEPSAQICSANKFMAPSDLTLPRFDDSSKVNAIFFLRQLDEFMKLKAVPVQFQLAIAFRSVTDPIAVQWLSTISSSIHNYEQFKLAFKRNFWSASKQSIIKCSIYQDRYQRGSDLSMSEHFLKYAVLASYLEPKMSDVEFMDAIKFHYPTYVQNSLATAQLTSIQDGLDLLKRLEGIATREDMRRFNPTASSQNPGPSRSQGTLDDRREHGRNGPRPHNQQVRQVYVQNHGNYQHRGNYGGNQQHRGNYSRNDRASYVQGPRPGQNNGLNPSAQEFRNHDQNGEGLNNVSHRQSTEN